jgi:tRNA (guanine-N7-)-methyltransferase
LAKRKLERFAENATFNHFFQPNFFDLQAGFPLRGSWRDDFFHNNNPVIVELGCGKGEYTVALAAKYPERNFIGIDKKGARMWRGGKTSHEQAMPNVAFVRSRAELIGYIFGENEVDEIWITFPEPQPNSPRSKKRFTSSQFLSRYSKILKPRGVLHLKTDSDLVYESTLEVIKAGGHSLHFSCDNLYQNNTDELVQDVIAVQTHYEKLWLEKGFTIKYLNFSLNPDTALDQNTNEITQ